MERSINEVTLLGRLGNDPEPHTYQQNGRLARLSVATSRLNSNGEEATQWHRVVCWGPLANAAVKYLGKGSRIMVKGSIRYGKYKDPEDGIVRYTSEIAANDIVFLDSQQRVSSTEPEDATIVYDEQSLGVQAGQVLQPVAFPDRDSLPF